jgi:hypothetical protein
MRGSGVSPTIAFATTRCSARRSHRLPKTRQPRRVARAVCHERDRELHPSRGRIRAASKPPDARAAFAAPCGRRHLDPRGFLYCDRPAQARNAASADPAVVADQDGRVAMAADRGHLRRAPRVRTTVLWQQEITARRKCDPEAPLGGGVHSGDQRVRGFATDRDPRPVWPLAGLARPFNRAGWSDQHLADDPRVELSLVKGRGIEGQPALSAAAGHRGHRRQRHGGCQAPLTRSHSPHHEPPSKGGFEAASSHRDWTADRTSPAQRDARTTGGLRYGADTSITRVPQFLRPSGVWLDFGGTYSVASQIDVPLGSITAHE